MAAVLGYILLNRRHSQSARWLHNAAGIDKNIFDCRAHRVGIDRNKFINQFFADAESLLAHQFDCRAV